MHFWRQWRRNRVFWLTLQWCVIGTGTNLAQRSERISAVIFAIIFAIWTLKKAKQSTLLTATREQLRNDAKALAGTDNDEQK